MEPMMPNNVRLAVAKILSSHRKLSVTTTENVVRECSVKLANMLPPAMVHMAIRDCFRREVKRQFKSQLPENVRVSLKSNFPPDLRDSIGKLPEWFAIEDGRGARHVLTIQATAEHWQMAFAMKQRKSRQTRSAANTSRNIGDVLMQLGVSCLNDLVAVSEAA